jgi:hypothetical protein
MSSLRRDGQELGVSAVLARKNHLLGVAIC